MSEKFNLSWESFQSNLQSSLRDLRENQDFCDVTLGAEDDQVQAHKIIISAGSLFFKKVLKRNVHANPLLYLKGIKMCDLRDILTFMYQGQVEVAEDNLAQFLAAANDLEILGLSKENQQKDHQWMFNRSTEMTVPITSPMTYPSKELMQEKPIPIPTRKKRKLKDEIQPWQLREEIMRNIENIENSEDKENYEEIENYEDAENYEDTEMDNQNEMTIDSHPVTAEFRESEIAEEELENNSEIYEEEDEALDEEITNLNSELQTLTSKMNNGYTSADLRGGDAYNPDGFKIENVLL